MSELREAAEEALRWMEHARLHLTIKERMHPDGLGLYDSATEALRAALAQPKTELRDQHKAFAKWFLTQNPVAPSPEDTAWAAWKAALAEPKTELRDQHKAFTHWYFGLRGINEANFNPEYLAWAAWKAALAQPEPEPVVIGPEWTPCVKLPITVHVREQRPDEQHVSTREGITPVKPDDLIMRGVAGEEYPIGRELFEKTYRIGAHPPSDEWRPASEPPEDGRDVVVWMNDGGHGCFAIGHCLRGNWSPNYIGSPVTHWRDVTPPTESPIAAKCQRIEGSGEICGLTPPCPDCGSSLIDVPEGSL